MNKFSNKFKKPCFWPIFGPFSQFWEQKKIWHCDAQLHMGFQHHTKIQKKLMVQFQKNAQIEGPKGRRMEGWTSAISYDPSSYHKRSVTPFPRITKATIILYEINIQFTIIFPRKKQVFINVLKICILDTILQNIMRDHLSQVISKTFVVQCLSDTRK